MRRLFGSRIKKVYFIVVLFTLFAFVIIVSTKIKAYQNWKGASGLACIAQILNAYFPGFDNMAVCFSIKDTNKLSTLFFDLYYAIPFKETIFGLRGDNLNSLFTTVSMTGGQIVPWGYQLSHYFSILGSPIITCLFVRTAYRNEIAGNRTDDFWFYYKRLYVSILIALSVSIYSFSIFLRSYINIVLPIVIIIYLGSRRKRNNYYRRDKNTNVEH